MDHIEYTEWQKALIEHLISSVPVSLLEGRGRRAGWTAALQKVEDILKWRGPGPYYLWDGARYEIIDGLPIVLRPSDEPPPSE